MSHFMKSICLLTPFALMACGESNSTATTSMNELVASAEAEDVKLAVHAESLSAETGEPIELIVTVEAPPKQRATLSLPEDNRLGDFDVIRSEDVRQSDDGLGIAQRHRLLVSTLASGEIELPALEAHYGSDSVLRTDPVNFTIVSLIEGEFDPNSFADIRPAVDDSIESERPEWVVPVAVVGGIAVIAAIAIALAIATRRRVKPRVPHEWALAELARIEAEGPPREDATSLRYEKIETVLRWYVAFRFQIDAPDRTSTELLDAVLEHGGIDDDARVILERIVRDADRVKFAGGHASRDECAIALGSARMFIEHTITTEETEEAA